MVWLVFQFHLMPAPMVRLLRTLLPKSNSTAKLGMVSNQSTAFVRKLKRCLKVSESLFTVASGAFFPCAHSVEVAAKNRKHRHTIRTKMWAFSCPNRYFLLSNNGFTYKHYLANVNLFIDICKKIRIFLKICRRKQNDVLNLVDSNECVKTQTLTIMRHGLHGFHGTHPLVNETSGHLDDTEIFHKSASSLPKKERGCA